MKKHNFALSSIFAALGLCPTFVSSQVGKIGTVTADPNNTVISAPATTNTTTNVVKAAPNATASGSVGAISGSGQLNNNPNFSASPLGISAPGSNSQFTPTANSGSVNWAPTSVNTNKSVGSSVNAAYSLALSLPTSVLAPNEVCRPFNIPHVPEAKPRTLVVSGMFGGAYSEYSMVRDPKTKELVPGLVTQSIPTTQDPSIPAYKKIVASVYLRKDGPNNSFLPGIARVEMEFGERWEVLTATNATSAGSTFLGSLTNNSGAGGLSGSGSAAVTDQSQLATWKGRDCLVNGDWTAQIINVSRSQTEEDCVTPMMRVNKDRNGRIVSYGPLELGPYVGNNACRERWGMARIKAWDLPAQK